MSSGTRAVVGLGIAGSAAVIFGSLIMVGYLFNDINNLYTEVITEMDEFRDLANDAWQGMMEFQRPAGKSQSDAVFQSIFRIKRQYDAAATGGSQQQCNCAAQPSNCPAGPPGPPGAAGEDGSDGEDGQPGQPGLDGAASDNLGYDVKSCISVSFPFSK